MPLKTLSGNFTAILPSQQLKVNKIIWIGIGLLCLSDLFLIVRWQFTVDIQNGYEFYIILGACFCISRLYRHLWRNDTLFLFSNVLSQIIIISVALGFLSYLSASLNRPLIDNTLIAIDHVLGFDWLNYITWINKHPFVGDIFTFAYSSFCMEILLFILLLFAINQSACAQRFVIAFSLSALTSILIAAAFPAVAGYVHYDIDVTRYPYLHPSAARIHEMYMIGLRDHSLRTLSFPFQGIITFPSFHSAVACLLIYYSLTLDRLRLISIPLNITMLFSTPIDGGHYLIDVLGGGFVAVEGIYVAKLLLPKNKHPNRPSAENSDSVSASSLTVTCSRRCRCC